MKLKSLQYYCSKNRILSILLKNREIVCIEITHDKLKLIVFDNNGFGGISYFFEEELSIAAKGYAWTDNKEEFRSIIEKIKLLLIGEEYDWQRLYFYIILTDYGYSDTLEVVGSTKSEIKEAIEYELPHHLPWRIDECCYLYVNDSPCQNTLEKNETFPLVRSIRIYSIEKSIVAVLKEGAGALNMNVLGVTTNAYVADCLMDEQDKVEIEFYDSFHNIQDLEELRKRYQFLIKVALLVVDGRLEIDFLPVDKQRNIYLKLAEKFCFGLSVVFFGITMILFSLIYGYGVYSKQQLSNTLEKYNSLVVWEHKAKEYKKIQNELFAMKKEIQKIHGEKIEWTNILESYGRTLPNGCWLERIEEKTIIRASKAKEKQIVLWGGAWDNHTIAQFIEGLEESKYYKLIELVSSETMENKKHNKAAEHYRFKILLEPPSKNTRGVVNNGV